MTEKKLVWDNCKELGDVLKSDRTMLKVELVARDGVKYINIREWYMKKSEGVWKPGVKGLSIPVAIPIEGNIELPAMELVELIQEGIDLAPNFKIEDPDNAVWYTKEA